MAPAGSALIVLAEGQEWGNLGKQRQATGDDGTAYICRGTVCFEPVVDIEELKTPLWSRC